MMAKFAKEIKWIKYSKTSIRNFKAGHLCPFDGVLASVFVCGAIYHDSGVHGTLRMAG